MKKLILIVFLLYISVIRAQYTLIPDYYFESFLVGSGIDTDGVINGQVLTADIVDVTQLVLTFENNITDLTGIEDFESLEILDINNIDLLEINLSQNINLRRLDISDVSLESLDISANINLVQFYLSLNHSEGNYSSPITELDVSNNILLNRIRIDHTLITAVDVSNNPNIVGLTMMDMSELTKLNINNGNNLEMQLAEILDNPNLSCLQVDNPQAVIEAQVYPYSQWIIEGNPLLEIVEDCNLGIDEVLEIQISIYPNPVKNALNIKNSSNDNIISIKIYDVMGRRVLNLNNPNHPLDVSNLEPGLFFVSIKATQGTLIKKFVKE